jgi:allantoicase
MDGQEARIRLRVSYDQCASTGGSQTIVKGTRVQARSFVTNYGTSHEVGKGSKSERFLYLEIILCASVIPLFLM